MILSPQEIAKIAATFPDDKALIVPIFDEGEPQLYDYLQSNAKPGQLDDSTLKPRAVSVIVTMDYGPKTRDGSFPSFDIAFWPPVNGACDTHNCGIVNNSYPPKEILKKLIAHSGYKMTFDLLHPDKIGTDPVTGKITDTAQVLGDNQQVPEDLTTAIKGTLVPSHQNARAERDAATKKEIERADKSEADRVAAEQEKNRSLIAGARAEKNALQPDPDELRKAKRRLNDKLKYAKRMEKKRLAKANAGMGNISQVVEAG